MGCRRMKEDSWQYKPCFEYGCLIEYVGMKEYSVQLYFSAT